MKPRVFILGLDGADDYSVGVAVRAGNMPNLTRLTGGRFLPLKSTPLPITPAAWTAAYTGYNPGKTGVLTFQRRIPNTYRGKIVNSNDVGDNGFHTRLAENGKKVISIGFPMMSPPPACHGAIIVSGWDSSPHVPLANDAQALEVLGRHGYRIDDDLTADPALLRQGISTRFSILGDLLAEHGDWDCAMVYLGFIDSLGHRLGFGNDETQELLAKTDKELGKLLPHLPSETPFIVCSDHGFGQFAQSFSVIQWLEEHGYLKLRSRNLRKSSHGTPGVELMDFEDGLIDWSSTRAFCWEAIGRHAAIALNTKGTYPGGVVNPRDAFALGGEIIEKLRTTVDPATCRPVVIDARRREELFWGARVSEFPELFLETAPGTTAYIGKRKRTESGFELEHGILHSGSFNSHHDDGVWGSSFEVPADDLRVEDLAPTVYALLDVPIPEDCDGVNRSPRRALVGATAGAAASTPENSAYSPEEEEIVRKRLEDLGYL